MEIRIVGPGSASTEEFINGHTAIRDHAGLSGLHDLLAPITGNNFVLSSGTIECEQSADILLYGLDPWSYRLLCLAGMVHNHHSIYIQWLLRCWSGCVVLLLIVLLILNADRLLTSTGAGYGFTVANILCATAALFQVLGILTGMVFNCRRLRSKYQTYELLGFERMQRVTRRVVVVIIVVSSLPIVAYYQFTLSETANALLFIEGLIASVMLGGNLMFLLADASVACHNLQSLLHDVDAGKELSMQKVANVRVEFKRVVHQGFYGSTAIVGSALLNVLTAFALTIVTTDSVIALFMEMTYLLFREITVSVVGLYYVAKVNEDFDELVRLLTEEISRKCCLDTADVERPSVTIMKANIILNSIVANPIKFPLAGMTLRRRDVLFRFGIWLFGVLLSASTKQIA
jgi:hypothetical protein